MTLKFVLNWSKIILWDNINYTFISAKLLKKTSNTWKFVQKVVWQNFISGKT